MLKMKYQSYDNHEDVEINDIVTVEKIEDVSFSYDGGRLTIMVNGKVLYCTYTAGTDCFVGLAVQ